MRSQESNYMYSSFTKSTIKNQNTQLTEKSVGITIRMFPDYPIEKSQYPINKKISGYYPIHQNFLSGALYITVTKTGDGTPYRSHGYVLLRFKGNVVMKMGTQQQHNNQDRYVNELVPPKTWTLLSSVWCIT